MVEAQLHSLIDTVDKRMREKNNKTFKGRFKQSLIHTFVDIKDIKEGVPKYADEIIKVMEKPKNKRKLKEALIDKVDEYFDKTFEEQDNTQVDKIIKKTSTQDTIEARTIAGGCCSRCTPQSIAGRTLAALRRRQCGAARGLRAAAAADRSAVAGVA